MKDIEVHLTQAQIQEIFAELPADELELPAQAIEVDEEELPFRLVVADGPPPYNFGDDFGDAFGEAGPSFPWFE